MLRLCCIVMSLQGFLLYHKTTRNSYLEAKDGPARPASNMDRFERCFSIFKLSNEEKQGTRQPQTLTENGVKTHAHTSSEIRHVTGEDEAAAGHKPWRAVRVDLVVSPISQFGFALLGWTGSKVTSHNGLLSSVSPLHLTGE